MRTFIVLCFTLIILSLNAENPWGKDADLSCTQISAEKKRCSTLVMGPLAETLIGIHQKYISPSDGPRSNYKPSSSQYMLDAIRKYGFFKGFPMGCDRLMRENPDPWIYRTITDDWGSRLKIDPVK